MNINTDQRYNQMIGNECIDLIIDLLANTQLNKGETDMSFMNNKSFTEELKQELVIVKSRLVQLIELRDCLVYT